jgi:hypothetical protein
MSLAAIPFDAATQAQQETGTSLVVGVTPGRQHYHVSAAKAWIRFDGTGTPTAAASYNISSITDNGTGDYTLNFTTSFSTATSYGFVCGVGDDSNLGAENWLINQGQAAPTASAFRLVTGLGGVGQADGSRAFASFFGDQ